ncbi:zinc metalloprotease HtpX [Selenomonas dianae]|uniref:Protease HtpX homolog n=1 Tax=Selenomonas dianae TaxID=135079 RepID=A0ABP3CL19_9FIRM|nr:zinc metalloprotease HtpX [Selenomonas dianae]WLD81810.1 zinc metalloprotease HtpX [Selenomonas dianae]
MNTLKTTMLMALLMALMVALGGIFAGHTGMTVMLIIALGMNFFSYWFSDRMVLSMYNAQEVDRQSAPELYGLVEKLAGRAGLPMPRVYIINEDAPNAFATGRNPSNAAVAVTTGLMRVLDYNEISGVLGHELAHVKHRDILISTIAATMATVISYAASIAQWAAIFGGGRSSDDDRGGIIGLIVTAIIAPIAAALIQMAISRSREYSADEGGAEICGNPNYLASALEKIEYYAVHGAQLPEATPSTAHMCIINPLTGRDISFKSLFSTHPDTQERIARLRAQAQRMNIR